MEKFIPNSDIYSIKKEGYTSDDEFIANRRVHISNEIPPQDLYDMIHSKMKNDYWKWFLGSTALFYDDINYNLETNAVETFDDEGIIIQPSISKYINGIRAKDYGPIPDLKYNPKTDKYDIINKIYPRIEINGAFMPEMDFMLHEGYRYLETLYPDHPDFTELLTTNEINDDINHTATLLNYNPNIIFFDWLSTYCDFNNIEDHELDYYREREAFKLKIRNLKNHTFRRKFYGAKSGYNMFGSEIFQHVSIFPVADYLPFKLREIEKGVNSSKYTEGHKDFTWQKDIWNAPEQFRDDPINRFDRLYTKPFRLVDWDNSTYDYIHEYVPPTVVRGTAYPTPLSNYDIFEWPIDRDLKETDINSFKSYIPLTIQKDFYEGQKIQIKQCKHLDESEHKDSCFTSAYINAMFSEPAFNAKIRLDYEKNIFESLEQPPIPDYVTRIQLDSPAYPIYTKFDVYPSIKKTLQKAIDNNKAVIKKYKEDNPTWTETPENFLIIGTDEQKWLIKNGLVFYDFTNYDKLFDDNQINLLVHAARELYTLIPTKKSVKFTLEPHQDGCLFMPAQQLLTLYRQWLKFKINRTDKKNPQYVWSPTPAATGAYVNIGDIITKYLYSSDSLKGTYISEIVGITGGKLEFEITDSELFTERQRLQKVDLLNEEEIGKYGVVIQFSKNNELSAGKLAVVFGRPRVKYEGPDKNGKYTTTLIDFLIQAIPKTKSHELMLSLYSSYVSICEQKVTNLSYIFKLGTSIQKNNSYKTYYPKIDTITKQTETVLSAMEVLIKINKTGHVHPNDSYWQKVKIPFQTIISQYDAQPVLQEQLLNIYNQFVADTDKDWTIDRPDIFEKNCRDVLIELHRYNAEYIKWLTCNIAIDLDRSYYETINIQRLKDAEKKCLERIKAIDLQLNDMLMNRALLLKPFPINDIFMRDVSEEESSYSLLSRQDKFINLLSYDFDEFKNLSAFIKEPIYGKNGLLNKFDFGSVNTASVTTNNGDIINSTDNIKNHKDLTISWDHYVCTAFETEEESGDQYGKDYLKIYDLEDHKYITLNEDILTGVANSIDEKKFAYSTPMFLELFLPDWGMNNIRGEVIPPYQVEIRSVTTVGSNIISFVDDESIKRFACLSTGDKVIGNGVEDDIFITYINYDKKQITVDKTNKKEGEANYFFTITDDRVFTYLTRMNMFGKDISKEWHLYRKELARNKLIDSGSIFNHQNDQYSQTYLNGVLDLDKFYENWKFNLRNNIQFKRKFNEAVYFLHHRKKMFEYYLPPSVINCNNKLYLEIGAYKRFDTHQFNPKSKLQEEKYYTDQYIIKKEILDYLQDYLGELSRGSDVVNIGPMITAGTTSDGKVSEYGEEYTDPKIKLKFATYGWTANTLPYYIDIGVGELKSFWNKTDEDKKAKEISDQYRSYYNYDVYDQFGEQSELERISAQGIDLTKIDRTYWSALDNEFLDENGLPVIDSIDKPIMRMYIGEYEVQRFIDFKDYPNQKFSTIQFSVIKQVFKNLEKENEQKLKLLNKNFFINNIFENIKTFQYKGLYKIGNGDSETLESIIYFATKSEINDKDDFINYFYLGDWEPKYKIIKTETEQYNEIIYPNVPTNDNHVYYYSISEKFELENLKNETTNKNDLNLLFEPGTVLIYNYNDKKWEYKNFVFSGLYGHQNSLKSFINHNEFEKITIRNSYAPTHKDDNTHLEQEDDEDDDNTTEYVCRYTLKHRLLFKLLSSMKVFVNDSEKNLFFDPKDLKLIYDWYIGGLNENNMHELAIKLNYAPFDGQTLTDFYSAYLSSNNLTFKISQLPIDGFTNTLQLNKNQIYWFYFTVTDFSGEGDDRKTDWEIFKDTLKIEDGTGFALNYLNDDFYIIQLKNNQFLYQISSQEYYVLHNDDKITLVDQEEYNTFIGFYGDSKNNIFLYEKINEFNNKINLSFNHLLEGSVDIKFKIKPGFKGDGWKYEDNKLDYKKLLVEKIDLTEDNIYYDQDNYKLYTYNTNEKGIVEKFAIKQEENKFFKNVNFIYGEYSISYFIENEKYKKVPEIKNINGIKFNAEYLSLLDRILEIEQINVRSLYNVNLEHTLFSSYIDINGILKGIKVKEIEDEKKRYKPISISVGFEDAEEPKVTSNRLKFYTEVMKLYPTRNNYSEDYTEDEIYFDDAYWLDTGEKIYSPEIKKFTITKNLSNVDASKLFTYFKNTLILEGEIDLFTPDYIDFSKNTKLADALSYLRINDSIIKIEPLTDINIDKLEPFYTASGMTIDFIDFKLDKLLVVNNEQFQLNHILSATEISVGEEEGLSGAVFQFSELSRGTIAISGQNSFNYTDCTSISWDQTTKSWLMGMYNSNDENSNIYKLKIEGLGEQSKINDLGVSGLLSGYFNAFGNTEGIDINTFDIIPIKDINYGDPRYDTYVNVFARDVAITNAEYEQDIRDLTDQSWEPIPDNSYLNDSAAITDNDFSKKGVLFSSIGNVNVIERNNLNFSNINGYYANGVNDPKVNGIKSGGVWSSPEFEIDKNEFKTLTLDIRKVKDSSADTSLSIGAYKNIRNMIYYDKLVQKWVTIPDLINNHNFIQHYSSEESKHAKVYFCGAELGVKGPKNFGLINEKSSENGPQYIKDTINGSSTLKYPEETWEWLLPSPETTDELAFGFIMESPKTGENTTKTSLCVTIHKESENNQDVGVFQVENIKLSSKPILKCISGHIDDRTFIQDIPDNILVESTPKEGTIYEISGLIEGVYDPTLSEHLEQQDAKRSAKKWVKNNSLGYQVVIEGNTMFMYSPTKTINYEIENNNEINGWGLSDAFHWKRAELPSSENITYLLFKEMEKKGQEIEGYQNGFGGLNLVFELVSNQREHVMKLLSDRLTQLSSVPSTPGTPLDTEKMAISGLFNWITIHPPKHYDSMEELSKEESINETGIEILTVEQGNIIHINEKVHQQWVFFEPDMSMDNSSMLFLRKQTYLRYLADYYGLILGYQRFRDFFKKDNIKDITLTNKFLVFQTVLDDIITLDLQFATSRKDIENYNNWTVSNLENRLVFSSNTTGQFTKRTMMIDNKYITVEDFPIQQTSKAYHINEKYINNNVQLYVGYTKKNNAIDYLMTQAKSKEDVKWITDFISSDAKYNENDYHLSNAKYPIIFLSEDNGKNFKRIELEHGPVPSKGQGIPYINDHENIEDAEKDSSNSFHLEAAQLWTKGDKIYVGYRISTNTISTNDMENYGYTTFTFKETETETKIIYNNDIVLYDNYTNGKGGHKNQLATSIIRNAELYPRYKVFYVTEDANTNDKPGNIVPDIPGDINDTKKSGTYVLLSKPYNWNTSNSFITKLEDAAFNFSNAPAATSEGHNLIKVLVSINPFIPIENPTIYYNWKTEYLNQMGNISVPTQIIVDNIENANKLYSPRECMPISYNDKSGERDRLPKIGILSIKEDIDEIKKSETYASIYEYYDPFFNSAGEKVYKYKEAKNSEGQIIKLCNANGDYLSYRDSVSVNNYFDLKTMISNNVEYSSLVAAPILKPEFNAVQLYEALTNELNKRVFTKNQEIILGNNSNNEVVKICGEDQNWLINNINFTANQVQLELKNDIDLINWFKDNYNPEWNKENGCYKNAENDACSFYEWPTTINNEPIDPEILSPDNKFYNDFYNPKDPSHIPFLDWSKLRQKIEEMEGPFRDEKKITDRYNWIMIEFNKKDDDGNDIIEKKYYFVDKKQKIIPLKDQDNITLNMVIPYQFKNKYQEYNNYSFNNTDTSKSNLLAKFEQSYPLTSVYIPPKGYGGSINNTSWDKIRPEENDYIAFGFNTNNKSHRLAKNENEEFIYLCDNQGIRLINRDGLFWLKNNGTTVISWGRLFEKKQTVKFYRNEDSYEAESYLDYNFWKLPYSPVKIYTPRNGKISFNGPVGENTTESFNIGDEYKLLTLFFITKAGILVDSETLKKYTFDFDYVTTDENDDLRDRIIFDGTNKILYKYKNKNARGFCTDEYNIDDDEIIINITDDKGVKSQYILNIEKEEEKALVIDTKFVRFDKKELYNSQETEIELTFHEKTIKTEEQMPADNFESKDTSIVLNKNELTNPTKLKINIASYPQQNYIVFTYDENNIKKKFEIYLFLLNSNIEVITNKNWTILKNDNSCDLEVSLYSGDQEIKDKDKYKFHFSKQESYITYHDFKFDVNVTLIEKFEKRHINITDYIFTYNIDDSKTELEFKYSENNNQKNFYPGAPELVNEEKPKILISRLYGPTIFNYPKYKNFKELLQNEEQIINYKEKKIIYNYKEIIEKDLEENKIIDIEKSLSSFKLKNWLYDNEDTVEFLKIKILPIMTVESEIKYLNNKDYIQEVDVLEKNIFGYDRIWINNNLYTDPPLKYKNLLYNEENQKDYYKNNWLNKDGYKVYVCSKDGLFTKLILQNGKVLLDERTLGDSKGDCRNDIYGTVDPRFNLPEMIYKTSIDYYIDNYYIKGHEINPFVTRIDIKDEFNLVTQKFDKVYKILVPKKIGNYIDYIPEKNYIVSVKNLIDYSINKKIVTQNEKKEFIDYINGQLNFLIQGPEDSDQYKEYKYFYGIKYLNQFNYNIGLLKSYWDDKCEVKNNIITNFIINSKENLIDKKNKDYGIVDITEMGIFDKDGHLCAYMSHPKVQYRSDQQHISYNCIIKEV